MELAQFIQYIILKNIFCARPELDIIEEKIWSLCFINFYSSWVDKHIGVKELGRNRLCVND